MFCSLNRWLGFPQRIYVEKEYTLKNLINFYNGKRPCFESIHRFEDKITPYVDRIVNDHDSHLNWRIPYKEVKKLNDFALRKDIDNEIVCSGGKGFHWYIMFEEEPLTDLVNSKIFSIQHSLKKYFNLQSCDEPLFAKKGLLIRIPTTKHISLNKQTKKYVDNGNYCRYLTKDEFDKGLDYIEKIVKEPGVMPHKIKPKHTLDDIVSLIPNYKYREKTNGHLDIDLNPGGVLTPTIESIGLPCLKKLAKQEDPCYNDRRELAVWLKLQGYRDMAIAAFFRNQYKNFNAEKTMNILASLKPRFPQCTYLRDRFGGCENCSFKR